MLPFLEVEARGRVLPVVASVPHSGTFVPARARLRSVFEHALGRLLVREAE